MSIDTIKWVLEHSRAQHSARLVAIVLAEHAHSDGTESYPSIATIAREARLGESTVRLALDHLKALGEIVETGVSRRRTRSFVFPMTPAGSAPPQDLRPPVEGRAQHLALAPADPGDDPAGSAPEPSFIRKRTPPNAVEVEGRAEREDATQAQAATGVEGAEAEQETAPTPLEVFREQHEPLSSPLSFAEAERIARRLGYETGPLSTATIGAMRYGGDPDTIARYVNAFTEEPETETEAKVA